MTESIIKDKSYKFALNIIRFYSSLREKKEFVLSRQLLKAGTSIGANIEEALAGESKADFIHKMAIAAKEARETKYWLRLLKDSGIAENNTDVLINENDEIIKILSSIIKTLSAKNNFPPTHNSKLKTHNS
ncbi:MAG TPA: four helix bundle protein [Elusimicrobia bacterium]|nr:four helix bundle protein [Elusimicrobiota bacterium]